MRTGNTLWVTSEATRKMNMMFMCSTMMHGASACGAKMYGMMHENKMYSPISPDI